MLRPLVPIPLGPAGWPEDREKGRARTQPSPGKVDPKGSQFSTVLEGTLSLGATPAKISVLSPRQQTSADPLSPPRSSSPAGALPQLSSVARTTHCSHHPFKHKRGRLLLVTLCHKKKV